MPNLSEFTIEELQIALKVIKVFEDEDDNVGYMVSWIEDEINPPQPSIEIPSVQKKGSVVYKQRNIGWDK